MFILHLRLVNSGPIMEEGGLDGWRPFRHSILSKNTSYKKLLALSTVFFYGIPIFGQWVQGLASWKYSWWGIFLSVFPHHFLRKKNLELISSLLTSTWFIFYFAVFSQEVKITSLFVKNKILSTVPNPNSRQIVIVLLSNHW